MKTTVKRHKLTGALVWFPNEGMTGVVVRSSDPWKVGMTSKHWNPDDLESTNYEIEIKLKQK